MAGVYVESLERPACGVSREVKSNGGPEGWIRYYRKQCRHDLGCVVPADGTREGYYSGLRQRGSRVVRLQFDADTGDGELRQFCCTLTLCHGRSLDW